MWIKLVMGCPKYVAMNVQATVGEQYTTRIVETMNLGTFDLELDLSGLLEQAENLITPPKSSSDEFDLGIHWASHVILEAAKGWIKERNEK